MGVILGVWVDFLLDLCLRLRGFLPYRYPYWCGSNGCSMPEELSEYFAMLCSLALLLPRSLLCLEYSASSALTLALLSDWLEAEPPTSSALLSSTSMFHSHTT